MAKYVMIACCKEQNVEPCIAEDLYASDLFKKSLAHARSLVASSNIFILSTKYGLLRLTDVISSYDVPVPVGGWGAWSKKVESEKCGFRISSPFSKRLFCISLPNLRPKITPKSTSRQVRLLSSVR